MTFTFPGLFLFRCSVFVGIFLLSSAPSGAEEPVVIGSKKFTENIILAEVARELISHEGTNVEHWRDLGGTRILWDALSRGEIDIYPEYTGTLIEEILGDKQFADLAELEDYLRQTGIGMTGSLGFDNTYILGTLSETAEKYSLANISDLRGHPRLRFGFSNEFMNRSDGWPGLREAYQLPQQAVRGLDHDLAYRGLNGNAIDVIDLYATDAEIDYYNLVRLADDKNYFPEYEALFLYRLELLTSHPTVIEQLSRLEGSLSSGRMSKMNAAVKINRNAESQVASDFIQEEFDLHVAPETFTWLDRLFKHTMEHLTLVSISLSAAILIAIPAGIASARHKRLGQILLSVASLIQTIPSLALFVFMIPFLGIGGPPAVVALFLYSLLPIMRNTYSGLHDIPSEIRESAIAIGLPKIKILFWVELPLAARSILAGVKTSSVINVGTATLGALIGAGGYGQPILTGIRLDDIGLILQGAIPAAVLALLVQGMFELIERVLLPRSLRYQASGF